MCTAVENRCGYSGIGSTLSNSGGEGLCMFLIL